MFPDRPAGLRGPVWAMARPRLCDREGRLLHMAVAELRATGSTRARALALADAVARLAVLPFVAGDEFGAQLDRAAAALSTPSVASLASDPAIGVDALAMVEAMRAFEASGCRRLPPAEWSRADAALRAAVAKRLAERFRRGLK